MLTNPSARLRLCVAPKRCFSGPKTRGENLTNTAVPRHPSCSAFPVVTPRMRADSIAGIMRQQLGELYMFAHAPQERRPARSAPRSPNGSSTRRFTSRRFRCFGPALNPCSTAERPIGHSKKLASEQDVGCGQHPTPKLFRHGQPRGQRSGSTLISETTCRSSSTDMKRRMKSALKRGNGGRFGRTDRTSDRA